MPKGQRIVLFLILVTVLGVIFAIWRDTPVPTTSPDTIIFSALLMISFVTLFLEHWFTKPSDVLSASISIVLALTPLRQEFSGLGVWYWILLAYSSTCGFVALIALLSLKTDKSSHDPENQLSFRFRELATTFGNGRIQYFALFLLTMLFYVDNQSAFFLALLVYSAFIVLADPKSMILRQIGHRTSKDQRLGSIFGVQSSNSFLVKMTDDHPIVRRFDFVEFRRSGATANNVEKGMVVDNYRLQGEDWLRVLSTTDITDSIGPHQAESNPIEDAIYKIEAEDRNEIAVRFLGLVSDRTNIQTLRFEYTSDVSVSEGTLIEVNVRGKRVLYQIVQGVTEVELLESKNEAGIVIGHAAQLGVWNADSLAFDRFGWVPDINSPVYIASPIEDEAIPQNEFLVGYIPGTNYPILLNKSEAISHHIAILGVTGSGKSVFARNLIRQFAQDGTKFICVDFTQEYSNRFQDLNAASLVGDEDARAMSAAADSLVNERAKFPNQRTADVITRSEETMRRHFRQSLGAFLASAHPISIFELPDVENSTGILEYTKWFFKVLFEEAKRGALGQKICVVLEEAHTVVPEWNFVATEDKGAQAVVNSIGQIALQGRKYGVGFMVIAQRTANVSKTVLTQCNSIIAFQQFDKTSSDFLANYMGGEMVNALSTLQPRHAVATGKAFRSGTPAIFKVPEIEEIIRDEPDVADEVPF